MEQRISMVTLGVSDLARSRRFYEDLGWEVRLDPGAVFFQAGGMVLGLWGREQLAEDSGIGGDDGSSFSGIVLAHNVRSPGEVDELVRQAEAAGATVSQPPRPTFWGGYSGCFRDPDGHTWEIAHNPGLSLDDDGNASLSA